MKFAKEFSAFSCDINGFINEPDAEEGY